MKSPAPAGGSVVEVRVAPHATRVQAFTERPPSSAFGTFSRQREKEQQKTDNAS